MMRTALNPHSGCADINLRLPQRRSRLPGFGITVALVVVVLCGRHGLLWYATANADTRVQSLQTQTDTLTRGLTTLRATQAALDVGALASDDGVADPPTLAGGATTAVPLDPRIAVPSGGFAAALRSLARHDDHGVSLTRIRLDTTTQQLILDGQALDPARIATLIAHLHAQPALSGLVPQHVRLKRAVDTPWRIDFRLDHATATEAP